MSTSRLALAVAILTVTALPGAGQRPLAGEELASAKGTVTLNGQPLPFGKVIFHLADGQFVGSKLKEDGSFKIDRIPLGTHKVTVEATKKAATGKAMNVLPAKYAQEERSVLRIEVKKGRNQFDFDLTSR
jgi:hypothetical protein